jgi:hypothetical protein
MLKVGTQIRFIGAKDGKTLDDVTVGKVYTIEGHDNSGCNDHDDDPYFFDDENEQNWSASQYGGDGVYEIVYDVDTSSVFEITVKVRLVNGKLEIVQ